MHAVSKHKLCFSCTWGIRMQGCRDVVVGMADSMIGLSHGVRQLLF